MIIFTLYCHRFRKKLEKFLNKHSNVAILIINILQKVREVGGEKFSYANDCQIVTNLKKFENRYNLCILFIHHTSKQEADDSFDII